MDRQAELRQQYRALHYMQSYGKNDFSWHTWFTLLYRGHGLEDKGQNHRFRNSHWFIVHSSTKCLIGLNREWEWSRAVTDTVRPSTNKVFKLTVSGPSAIRCLVPRSPSCSSPERCRTKCWRLFLQGSFGFGAIDGTVVSTAFHRSTSAVTIQCLEAWMWLVYRRQLACRHTAVFYHRIQHENNFHANDSKISYGNT